VFKKGKVAGKKTKTRLSIVRRWKKKFCRKTMLQKKKNEGWGVGKLKKQTILQVQAISNKKGHGGKLGGTAITRGDWLTSATRLSGAPKHEKKFRKETKVC